VISPSPLQIGGNETARTFGYLSVALQRRSVAAYCWLTTFRATISGLFAEFFLGLAGLQYVCAGSCY